MTEAQVTIDGPEGKIRRKHPLAKCEECPLYGTGQFVPSTGPAKATLAVVGEAPGKDEARDGEPFVGVSGRLLNRVLAHHRISRREVFLSNAALCRDPSGATPPAKAIAACRPRLIQELQGRQVRDVVALGNSAAKSILATKTGITSLRIGYGRANETDLPDVRVIPTFHPAASLRSPQFFPSIVTDFGKLKGHYSAWYPPVWKVFDDPPNALQALRELEQRHGPVVVDIESDIEKDVSFEHPTRHTLLCVGLGYETGKVAVLGEVALRDPQVRDALRRYLSVRKLVGQNLKFDNKGLWAYLGIALKVWFDTMLGSYCLDERRGIHSLEYQGIERLGTPDWKHDLDKYEPKKYGYGAVPRDVLYKYNAWDVHVTDLLKALLIKQMVAAGRSRPVKTRADGYVPSLLDLQSFLCRASDQLMFVELNGIAIDLKYNAELWTEHARSLDAMRESIQLSIPGNELENGTITGPWANFNPNSPIQVRKVVTGVFGHRLPYKLNQKKEYAETTDKEALTNLLEENFGTPSADFYQLMLEHRNEAKEFGTYVKGIRKRVWRGRVYTTFLLHGTTSGRLSSRNPNLQNIKRSENIKRQFTPDLRAHPEHVFIQGDYAQNEGRTLCWLAGDEFLREIFNDPTRDLFDELQPRLYGNPQGLSPEALKELRIRVKAYFYGLAYGREAKSIAIEFKLPLHEAERGMREFFRVIPQTVKFRDAIWQQVLSGRDLVTPFGRHHRVWLVTNENRKDIRNEALAFLPQSIASDICLDAFIHIRPRLKGTGYIRNLVHDSILAECHADNVRAVRDIMNEEMLASARRVVGDYVKFKVDFEVGKSWGDLKKLELAA